MKLQPAEIWLRVGLTPRSPLGVPGGWPKVANSCPDICGGAQVGSGRQEEGAWRAVVCAVLPARSSPASPKLAALCRERMLSAPASFLLSWGQNMDLGRHRAPCAQPVPIPSTTSLSRRHTEVAVTKLRLREISDVPTPHSWWEVPRGCHPGWSPGPRPCSSLLPLFLSFTTWGLASWAHRLRTMTPLGAPKVFCLFIYFP